MIFSPDFTVLAAGGIQTLAYLFINQVWLRVTAFAGTCLYVVYYLTVSDSPLWAAIVVSCAMGVANLAGLAGLWLKNSPLMIPARFRTLYERFHSIPPGDFRRLMSVANWEVLEAPREITRENEPADRLFFILDGQAEVEKMGQTFILEPNVFVGEVAYLTGRAPSATTRLPQGAEILSWKTSDLHRLGRKRGTLKLAIEAMISNDLASKVAASVAATRKAG